MFLPWGTFNSYYNTHIIRYIVLIIPLDKLFYAVSSLCSRNTKRIRVLTYPKWHWLSLYIVSEFESTRTGNRS